MTIKQVASLNEAAARSPAGTRAAGAPEERDTWSGPGRALAWLAKEFVRTLSSVDLSPPQYRALTLLAGGPSMSSMLASRLAVSPPSITNLVDGLVSRGLVERRHSEDDRRRIALSLTKAGHDLLVRADEAIEAGLSEIAGHLTLEGRRRALDGLALWSDALAERHAAGKGSREVEQHTNPAAR